MTPRHRLYALITGTMLALAIATTAESRRLDVTDTTPTAAVTVATAERPTPAARPPSALHNPNPYAAWACGGTRPRGDMRLLHAHPESYVYDQAGNPVLISTCVAIHDPTGQVAGWSTYLLYDGTPFGPINGYHWY